MGKAKPIHQYDLNGKYIKSYSTIQEAADFHKRDESVIRKAAHNGDFSADSWFWKQVAVTDYLNDLKGAIQIHHAVDDAVVNIGYSRNLMKLLDGTHVPHELFEYPDGGHNIAGSSFTKAFERTVTFFKEKLR